jgi:hypothetical protein
VLGELPRWRHRWSSMVRPIPHYGAPSWMWFLPMGAAGCEKLTKGSLAAGSSKAGCAAARLKLRPSAMVARSSKEQLTTRLGKMGVAQDVDHRCRVDGAREASHMT